MILKLPTVTVIILLRKKRCKASVCCQETKLHDEFTFNSSRMAVLGTVYLWNSRGERRAIKEK